MFLLPLPAAHGRKDKNALEITCSCVVHSPIFKSPPACVTCQVHQSNNLPSSLPCPPRSEQPAWQRLPLEFQRDLILESGHQTQRQWNQCWKRAAHRKVGVSTKFVVLLFLLTKGNSLKPLSEEPVKLSQYKTPTSFNSFRCQLRGL